MTQEKNKNECRWWDAPWWENTQVYLTIPPREITVVAQHLLPDFGDEWIKSVFNSEPKTGRNFLIPKLLWGQSTSDASFVYYWALAMKRLANSPGIKRQIKALKNAECEKSRATYLEIEIANIFAERGIPVAFPAEGGARSHDISVDANDVPVAIECKYFQLQEWEEWTELLQRDLIIQLPSEYSGQPIAVQITLHPKLSDMRLREPDFASANDEMRNAIVRLIRSEVDRVLQAGSLPCSAELHGLATITVDHPNDQFHTTIADPGLADAAKVRRIIQKIFEDALPQLPEDRAGIIVIQALQIPSPVLLALAFDAVIEADPTRSSKLAGVMLLQQQNMLAGYQQPVFLINKLSRWNNHKLIAMNTLVDACRALCINAVA